MRHLRILTIAGSILFWIAFAWVFVRADAAPASSAPPAVQAVDSIAIPVLDADRSVDFYARVLNFRKVADREIAGDAYEHLFGQFGLRARSVRMQLGGEYIELVQFLTPHGRPLPADFHSNDRWFQHIAIIVSNMDKAFDVLREQHVAFASPSPQVLPCWNPNAAGIAAFYFKDPDGNHLEILHFPPDKGAPKWRKLASGSSLFLGIDHTAIVVAHTEDSLRYYRDTLGLTVAGESDNYGPEQERLNNVFGAHLRITALRAPGGPGIELLEYLTPRTGRPYPLDSVASDQWQWIVNLRVQPDTRVESIPRLRDQVWISSEPTALKSAVLGYGEAFMLRDPDGHADNLILR
jgi:catechol 2,3-dioxygenase-like lactoylglutathione lyase family enzyme